jgi:hypothetical protein
VQHGATRNDDLDDAMIVDGRSLRAHDRHGHDDAVIDAEYEVTDRDRRDGAIAERRGDGRVRRGAHAR